MRLRSCGRPRKVKGFRVFRRPVDDRVRICGRSRACAVVGGDAATKPRAADEVSEVAEPDAHVRQWTPAASEPVSFVLVGIPGELARADALHAALAARAALREVRLVGGLGDGLAPLLAVERVVAADEDG